MLETNVQMMGAVQLTLTDSSGIIKQQVECKNLVVTTGKEWIASRMTTSPATLMSHMAIGTTNTTPANGNTTLITQVGRVALTSTTRSGAQITYSAHFPAGTGTGAIVEAGIFNDGTAGSMLCRTAFAAINKDVADTLTINWTVTVL